MDDDVEGVSVCRMWRWTGYGRPDMLIIGRAWIYSSSEPWRAYEAWRVRNMVRVDNARLGNVPQDVLASFSIGNRGVLVQVGTHTYLHLFFSTLKSLALPACDPAADPSAAEAAPDRARHGEWLTSCRQMNLRVYARQMRSMKSASGGLQFRTWRSIPERVLASFSVGDCGLLVQVLIHLTSYSPPALRPLCFPDAHPHSN
jgi:hypothetical protein